MILLCRKSKMDFIHPLVNRHKTNFSHNLYNSKKKKTLVIKIVLTANSAVPGL